MSRNNYLTNNQELMTGWFYLYRVSKKNIGTNWHILITNLMYKKLGSRSIYSVKNIEHLTSIWTWIFVHRFKNNEGVLTMFSTELHYSVWNAIISRKSLEEHSNSINGPVCNVNYDLKYVAFSSALFGRGLCPVQLEYLC